MSRPTRRQKVKAQQKRNPPTEATGFDRAYAALQAQQAAQYEPDYQPPEMPPGTVWDVG